jgi:ethanolamine utilization protein EutA (predicted chaperonin)
VLGYKTAEQVAFLIRDVARHEDFFICHVDASAAIDEKAIDALIEKHVHNHNIYTTTKLSTPGIHITSDTHRYERTLSDDMDAMLGKLHAA